MQPACSIIRLATAAQHTRQRLHADEEFHADTCPCNRVLKPRENLRTLAVQLYQQYQLHPAVSCWPCILVLLDKQLRLELGAWCSLRTAGVQSKVVDSCLTRAFGSKTRYHMEQEEATGSDRKRLRMTPTTIILHPVSPEALTCLQPETTLVLTDLATSQGEFRDKQREALAELQALYKEEYATLNKVLNAINSSTSSAQGQVKPSMPQPASTEAQQPVQQEDPQPNQGQPPAAPPNKPSQGPLPASSAACSADTSAGKAVASFNNWMGAGMPSTGTPQSFYRASRVHAATHPPDGRPPPPVHPQPPQPLPAANPSGSSQEPPTTPPPAPAPPAYDAPAQANPSSTPPTGLKLFPDPAPSNPQQADGDPQPPNGNTGQQQQPGETDKQPLPAAVGMQTPSSAKLTTIREEAPGTEGGNTTDRPEGDRPATDTRGEAQGAEQTTAREEVVGAQSQGGVLPEGGKEAVVAGAVGGKEAAVAEVVGLTQEQEAQLLAVQARQRFGGAAAVKQLVQLEGLASAITEQELEFQDALACLVGHKGRYLVRQSNVLLGRTTESKGEVDVDLSEESPDVQQVSRRQAYLGLQPDGQWALTNAGRRPVRVDGRPLAQFEAARLQHGSMVEVGGGALMLMVNTGAVERVLRRMQRAAA